MRLILFPILLFVLGGTLAWLLADQLALPDDYDAVVAWLRTKGDVAWLVGAGVIMGDALLPLPSAPAMFAMGVIYGPVVGTLIAGTAMVGASLVGYGALRLLGRDLAARIVGERDLAATERFYERWGLTAVILGRAIGGPAEWAVLFAGLSRMPFRRVLLGIALGSYVASAVVASLGATSTYEPELAFVLSVGLAGIVALVSRRMIRASEDAGRGESD